MLTASPERRARRQATRHPAIDAALNFTRQRLREESLASRILPAIRIEMGNESWNTTMPWASALWMTGPRPSAAIRTIADEAVRTMAEAMGPPPPYRLGSRLSSAAAMAEPDNHLGIAILPRDPERRRRILDATF